MEITNPKATVVDVSRPEARPAGYPDGAEEAAELRPLSRQEILTRGRAAFREEIERSKTRLVDPLLGEFYVFPMTLSEKSVLYGAYEENKILALARVIVSRARDVDGRRILQKPDAEVIAREWRSEDVERIADKISEVGKDNESAIEAGEEIDPGN